MFVIATKRSTQFGIIAAILIVLTFSAFFLVNVELTAWSKLVVALIVIFFWVPAFWAAKMWLGWRDSLVLIVVLGLFALLVEVADAVIGLRYGLTGYMSFAPVPWTVAFSWTPLLVLASYTIAGKFSSTRVLRVLLTAAVLVLFHLVLAMPASFAVSLASALVGAILVETLVSYLKPLLPIPVQLTSGAFVIVFLWTALNAFAGLLIPAFVGVVVLSGLVLIWHRHYFAFDDMIVLVDEDNNAIGTAKRRDAHNARTQLHRAFSVFIFNQHGQVLLQQRAFTKKTWPGVWSNSCCGHVMLHESTDSAAARRLNHELGLSDIRLVTALPEFRYRAEKDGIVENEICPVLVGMTDRDPTLNPTEVANISWIDWNEFVVGLEKPGVDLSPWAIEEARLLANSPLFKEWYSRRIPVSDPALAPVC